jgi:hypothetical protein
MLTQVVCPNCGHVGATAAQLPRVLICSKCRHGTLIRSGRPAMSPSVAREEQAAAHASWERYGAGAVSPMGPSSRKRFPPPWSQGDRSAAHLMTRDEARRTAVNIARLPGCLPRERQ